MKFLITRDGYATGQPLEVRNLVREGGYDSLDAAVAAAIAQGTAREDTSEDIPVHRIADDAVLLMIGNTPELLPALEAAYNQGSSGTIAMVATENDHPLRRYFVRIMVHPISRQTDTLMAIGSANLGWSGAPWQDSDGAAGTTYVTTYAPERIDVDNSAQMARTRALPDMIRWVKSQRPDASVNA